MGSTLTRQAETTAPASASSNAPQPTEKEVGSNNSFSPTVKAPPAPTELPGNVVTGG